ncbi:bolA-like protein 3 isoform X2 [Seriola lalandi dorsalis]|uniref:BolA-like protein 3 n=2 Tax=Seriola TaxID=8160 RepID=A0A3B4VP66_SERDU|nr:bolA-like protein 3 isoform X2 [Seriola dumerili]XP_023255561.1 bolA-like protein 3 isoform X2 [Seriola lalandi dorsalis]XP_056232929.1 bolA-like protein 3 isoform X2 [Seriola aureovittata]
MLACKRSLTSTMTSALRVLRSNPVAVCSQVQRRLSTQTDGEVRIAQILKEKFPSASSLKVVDISGGCGAMYEIHIESSEFKGKRTVQQHQLVNQALKDEIQGMHGLRIFTEIPKH